MFCIPFIRLILWHFDNSDFELFEHLKLLLNSVTIGIFAALTLSFDQSLLHLYVVFVAFAGIGMITPPVCVGIYTAAGVIKENPANAFKEVPLFTIVGIVYGILMILFPKFSTWLPSLL